MDLLIEAARSYLGTPFAHQGRQRDVGVDCVGLLAGACAAAGLVCPDVPADYGRAPDGTLERALDRYCQRVIDGSVLVGDVLVYRIYSMHPRHLALVSGVAPLRMIHAYEGAHKVTEHQVSEWWRARLHSVWRFAHVSEPPLDTAQQVAA